MTAIHSSKQAWLSAFVLGVVLVFAGPFLMPQQAAGAEENIYYLTADQWNVPRKVSTILGMAPLQGAIRQFQENPTSSVIVIKYPGGDTGTLWASELRSWLVSLGVGSAHIELVPGSAREDRLEIQVSIVRSRQ